MPYIIIAIIIITLLFVLPSASSSVLL